MKLQDILTPSRPLIEAGASRGSQLLEFADYMHRLEGMTDYPKIVANAARFRKLGTALFKLGFTYESFSVTFYKLPAEGGMYELKLPGFSDTYGLEMGYVKCSHSHTEDGTEKGTMYRFEKTMSLTEIEHFTVPVFIDFMKQAARP